LHESQLPLQAVSQQTPSAQKLDWHWLDWLQGAPMGPGPELPVLHWPPTHFAGVAHCASVVQEFGQLGLDPLHRYAPQVLVWGGDPEGRLVQVPGLLPTAQESHGLSHVVWQQTPSTQMLDWHWLDWLQGCPTGILSVH
jgi:hypothetical protein